jgi:hypothetical protein
MPDKRAQAAQMRGDVPQTIARSDDKAVRTFKKALEAAEQQYGEGERARRIAMAALKHTHEKVGDHWEPKPEPGPSDPQAAREGASAREEPGPTAQGVDASASKQHLTDVARRVGVESPQRMSKPELVEAIEKANRRATDRSRRNG